MSSDPFFWAVALACLAVLLVLGLGIASFAKGGEFNRKNANKLMRWRLGLQFIAVIAILIFVYFQRAG